MSKAGKKIIGIIMVIVCIGSASLFADSLWRIADEIAQESSSLIPAMTEITYGETNGFGVQMTEEEAVILHGENRIGSLTVREFGEDDVFAVIRTFTEGLAFSPFAEGVEELEYEQTGRSELVGGIRAVEYEFDLVIDEALIKYDSFVESGTDVEIEGSVWIAADEGYAVKVELAYSKYDNYTGSLAITQETLFQYEDGQWLPLKTLTKGKQVFTRPDKTEKRIDFILTEAYAKFFEAESYAR